MSAQVHISLHRLALAGWLTPNPLCVRSLDSQSATHCIVFARLLIDGRDHGVHNFIVPIRYEKTGPSSGPLSAIHHRSLPAKCKEHGHWTPLARRDHRRHRKQVGPTRKRTFIALCV